MSAHRIGGQGGGTGSRGSPAALLLICGLLAAAGVGAGCGEDEEPTATAAQTTAGEANATAGEAQAENAEATDEVEISDFEFRPEAITVEAGTKVTWTNGDEAPHTATADDGSFDTGTLDLDDAAGVTLDEAGTYSYYCRFHPFMKAAVEVR
jgi:plastocyanin